MESHQNKDPFNSCARALSDISQLFDKTGTLEIRMSSLSSNMNLLVKILGGTALVAATMLGSIYLSVAKIDKQVAMIVTTVSKSNIDQNKLETRVYDIERKVNQLEISCQDVKSTIRNYK
jgi:hypothetical protein